MYFANLRLEAFWRESVFADKQYTGPPLTDELIASVETELGVRLPPSYIALMRTRNGGIPFDQCFPTTSPTSWADDHVRITGIMGIGRDKTYSLCGALGSRFMQEEWGYPEIGVCICDSPSAGHDMIMFDYRKCGPQGEPEVVHVDQERDYKVTFLASDFESFIQGLVNESVYDTSAETLRDDLKKVEHGSFSATLDQLLQSADRPAVERILRNVCRELTKEKGHFSLHDDAKSYLVFDLLFHLFSSSFRVTSKDEYLTAYPHLIAFGDGGFSTGGYCPDFVNDWFRTRLSNGEIVLTDEGAYVFNHTFLQAFYPRIRAFESR